MAKGGFGGFGGGANMQQLMRQAQKMQQDMEKAQQELADTQLEASAGGGMVICTVTGTKEIVSLKINHEIVDPEDVEMLEDTVLAAVREAVAKAEELYKNKMGAIAGGMGGLF